MQTQTIKTELLINGQQVSIGHEYLEDTIRDIPDIQDNANIFDILSLSDNPDVRDSIARKEHLNKQTIYRLLNDSSQDIVESVLSNTDINKYIKNKTLLKIIKTDNIKYLIAIAQNIEDYVKCDQCKIVKILSTHKNPLVRYNLIHYRVSEVISTKILKKLSRDNDITVAQKAQERLDNRNR
jgi:DNA-binding phage protein